MARFLVILLHPFVSFIEGEINNIFNFLDLFKNSIPPKINSYILSSFGNKLNEYRTYNSVYNYFFHEMNNNFKIIF